MIIGISGYKGSGKDTFAKAIQYCLAKPQLDNHFITDSLGVGLRLSSPPIRIAKFAAPIYKAVAAMLGTTPELVERDKNEMVPGLNMTIREMLIAIGTTGLRSVDPDIFVKLFARQELVDTKAHLWQKKIGAIHISVYSTTLCGIPMLGNNYAEKGSLVTCPECYSLAAPDLLITDMRFKNELRFVKEQGGITVRVLNNRVPVPVNEETENSIDNVEHDFLISNNGSYLNLVTTARDFLLNINI